MNAEEFIASLSDVSRRNVYRFEQLRAGVPLGRDAAGNIVTAHKEETGLYRQVCVTGAGRQEFICRTIITCACLYDKSQAMFLVLSPDQGYSLLLRLTSADITIPYIRQYNDYAAVLENIRELIHMRSLGGAFPRLFIVLDGLEDLPDVVRDGVLQPYKSCFDIVRGAADVEIVTGVELRESIFSGYPGAFVGVGNCLVTPKGEGKADFTQVGMDSSLSLPREISYPDFPALEKSIEFFNSIP